MKPFRFTLEPLRVLRERQEHDAMAAYAQTLAEQQRAMRIQLELEREIQQALNEGKRRLLAHSSITQITQHQLYCTHLAQEIKAASAQVAAAEEKVKQAMQVMMAARQQREVVDKFLANQRSAYDREMTIEEQKTLDELAGRRLEPTLNWRTPSYE